MKHNVALVSTFLKEGWRAECSCGWVGPDRIEMPLTYGDFEAHEAHVAGLDNDVPSAESPYGTGRP